MRRSNNRKVREKTRNRTESRCARSLDIELLEGRRLLAVLGSDLSTGIAIATAAQYTAISGGTASVLASSPSFVDQLNPKSERGLTTDSDFISNNNDIIFTNIATEEFSNDIDSLIDQSQTVIDTEIEDLNDDVGLVIDTVAIGGLAGSEDSDTTTHQVATNISAAYFNHTLVDQEAKQITENTLTSVAGVSLDVVTAGSITAGSITAGSITSGSIPLGLLSIILRVSSLKLTLLVRPQRRSKNTFPNRTKTMWRSMMRPD